MDVTDLKDRVLGYLVDMSGVREPLTPERVQLALDQGLTPDAFKDLDIQTGALVSTHHSQLAEVAITFFRKEHRPITDRLIQLELDKRKLSPETKAGYLSILANVHHRRNGGGDWFREANVVHLTKELVDGCRENAAKAAFIRFVRETDPERKEELARLVQKEYLDRAVSDEPEDEQLDLVEAYRKDIERYESTEREGIPEDAVITGFPLFDREILYLRPMDTLFIGGRPTMQKSMQAEWILYQNYRRGRNVAYVNVEDPYEEQRLRLAGFVIKANTKAIREGKLPKHKKEILHKLPEAFEKRQNKFTIVPPGKVRCVADAESFLYSQLKKGEIDLIAFDYIQVFSPSTGRYQDKREQVNLVIDEMLQFVKRWELPAIICSQFKREAEMLERPTLDCFAESSVIEWRATHAWGIVKDRLQPGVFINHVLKSKTGKKDYDVPYRFYPDQFVIEPLESTGGALY